MREPLTSIATILLVPYRCLAEALGFNVDSLTLAHLIWITLIIVAFILRLLRFRRIFKAIAITALVLSLPPCLVTIALLINKLLQ